MVGARRAAAAPEPVTLVPTASAALPSWSRAETERFVGLLVVVVGLILLVGCANLAGLMLARNEQRRGEAALRVALGVSRLRLLRLFLVETLLLAGGGALAGLLVALWLLQGVEPLRASRRRSDWRVGLRVVRVAGGIRSGRGRRTTVLLCGVMPALQVLHMEVLPVLQGHPAGGRGGAWRTRGALLAGQVAMTVLLVIGAALFLRSLRAAVTTDVGADADRIFYTSVRFPFAGYDEARVADFYDRVGARLRGMPGVERVTFGHLPLVNSVADVPDVTLNGRTRRLPQLASIFMGGPGYARTVGLALQSGRDIGPRDVAGSEPVAIVNESLARHLWPGRGAVGQRFTFNPLTADVQVVGIVRDGKYRGLRDDRRIRRLPAPWRSIAGSPSGAEPSSAVRTATPALSSRCSSSRCGLSIPTCRSPRRPRSRAASRRWRCRNGWVRSLLGGLGGLALVLAHPRRLRLGRIRRDQTDAGDRRPHRPRRGHAGDCRDGVVENAVLRGRRNRRRPRCRPRRSPASSSSSCSAWRRAIR